MTHEDTDITLREQSLRQILRRINRMVSFEVIASILIIALCVVIYRNAIPESYLHYWVYASLFSLLARSLIAWGFGRYSGLHSLTWWSQLFIFGYLLTGVAWGSIVFLIPDQLEPLLSVTVILAGLISGILGSAGMRLPMFAAFIVPIVLSVVVRFLSIDQGVFQGLAIAAATYLVAVLFIAHNYAQTLFESVFLRFKNEALTSQIVKEKGAAERANADKTRFLAAASHDLRQPIHAVELFAEALGREHIAPRQTMILGKLRDSVASVSDLLNTLLDISNLDADMIRPQPCAVAVTPLFTQLHNEFSEQLETKQLKLTIDNEDTELAIKSDPILLANILRNLLSNAIKYTHHGGIRLGCIKQGKDCLIRVVDSGVGISKREQKKVFDEFYQVDNPERNSGKGLGLGLAIVRRLCALLEHQLEMHSTEHGTVFEIKVPWVPESMWQPHHTADVTNSYLRLSASVLVIDDNKDVLDAMKIMLEGWGCTVLVAESLNNALSALQEYPNIDIIIADYRLRNHILGSDVILQVRDILDKPELPGIIISGDIAPDRLKSMRRTGFDVLHKPVKPVQVRALMQNLLRGRERFV